MPRDSVAGVLCLSIAGEPQFSQQTLSEVTRVAENGRAFRKEGVRAPEFSILTVIDRPSAEDVYATYRSLAAAQVASTATFVKNGVTVGSFHVLAVHLRECKMFANSTEGVTVPGNQPGWRAVFEWRMVETSLQAAGVVT